VAAEQEAVDEGGDPHHERLPRPFLTLRLRRSGTATAAAGQQAVQGRRALVLEQRPAAEDLRRPQTGPRPLRCTKLFAILGEALPSCNLLTGPPPPRCAHPEAGEISAVCEPPTFERPIDHQPPNPPPPSPCKSRTQSPHPPKPGRGPGPIAGGGLGASSGVEHHGTLALGSGWRSGGGEGSTGYWRPRPRAHIRGGMLTIAEKGSS